MKKRIFRLSIMLIVGFVACQKGPIVPPNELKSDLANGNGSKRTLVLNPTSLDFVNDGRFLDFATRAQQEAIVSDVSREIEEIVKSNLNEISHESWWKKRPCKSNSVGTHKYGYHYTEKLYGKSKQPVYTGTKNLNGYYFFVQGRASYSDGTKTLATPYGGRNINSPY